MGNDKIPSNILNFTLIIVTPFLTRAFTSLIFHKVSEGISVLPAIHQVPKNITLLGLWHFLGGISISASLSTCHAIPSAFPTFSGEVSPIQILLIYWYSFLSWGNETVCRNLASAVWVVVGKCLYPYENLLRHIVFLPKQASLYPTPSWDP